MIFADKLIALRKKNGWSQEEFAEKMGVSRQAVSKWEGAQTVPDLDKILMMARLFGVTTDYLLKDEIEAEEHVSDGEEGTTRRVSLALAQEYLAWRASAAKRIALGVTLCILAAIPLILLGGTCELHAIPENLALAIGLIALLVIVASAVAIMVHCGFLNAPYEFLDKESFTLEYGVEGMVRERQKHYRATYGTTNIIGVVLCILSPLPLVVGALLELDGVWLICLTCLLLAIIATAVYLFVRVGTMWGAMQRLLGEGDFSKQAKTKNILEETVSGAYWCIVTAGYLAWSFLCSNWHISWIIWPIASVLYGGIEVIVRYRENGRKN